MNTAALITPAALPTLGLANLSMQPLFAIFRKRSQLPQTKPTQKISKNNVGR
jgi:hypothetical protein